MPIYLFNRKTLQRHARVQPIPPTQLAAVNQWADFIRSRRIYQLKETALHGQFTTLIIETVLGYRGAASGAHYTVANEQAILRGSVDLALGYFGNEQPQIIAPLELKGAHTTNLDAIMPGRNKSPVQQAWEYAIHAPGVQWVLVCNYVELRLYAFGAGTETYECFYLERLTEPAEYARFVLLLAADQLLTGHTLALLQESRREDQDITERLYSDYKTLRQQLIDAINVTGTIDPLAAIASAQKILDRILFIAFAEDTGLLPRQTLERAVTTINPFNPQPLWNNFVGLFRAIDQGSAQLKIPRYNGGLFAADAVIDELTLPDDICAGWQTIDQYDFASEVSVTILGHIFEQSIGDIERLQAAARGELTTDNKTTRGRRKRDGVVYTPDHIARFIVTATLGAHVRELFHTIVGEYAQPDTSITDYAAIVWKNKTAELAAWVDYRQRLLQLRIVDPACGSGVFLIMAFEFLKAELLRVTDKIATLAGRSGVVDDLFDPDRAILANNLFGVDVNAESVEITKLSLWVKTAQRGKVLEDLSRNICVGDSLIEGANDAYSQHGFEWGSAFSQIMIDEGGFDVVLGNPPYVRQECFTALKPALKLRFEVYHGVADLYCYFYERGVRLLKPGGRLGFISSSTFFKTGAGRPLREYLLKHATLETMIDFGDTQLFAGVTTYPAIMTLQRQSAPLNHQVRFLRATLLPDESLQTRWEQAASDYPQAALNAGSWELTDAPLRALRNKICANKPTLKTVYGAPCRGIVTGFNDAFVIDTPTKEQLCRIDPRSAELLKPFLEGKDVKRWRAEPRGLWLIYIPKKRIVIDDYPAIRDHLLLFKNQLEQRSNRQAWFELQSPQETYLRYLQQHKISYPHFSAAPQFSFETTGALINDKSYFIPSADRALLALLNSRVLWFIASAMSPTVRGGYHELRVQYVEQLPIPAIPAAPRQSLSELAERAQTAAVTRYQQQLQFTRRIPDLCASTRPAPLTTVLQTWWQLPDFSAFRAAIKKAFKSDIPLAERTAWEEYFHNEQRAIVQLTAEITRIETDIDQLVYALFDLNADEIALLETALAH